MMAEERKLSRAYKTELAPNQSQIAFFERNIVAAQTVYNMALRESIRRYKKTGKYVSSRNVLKKDFNAQKKHEIDRGNWQWYEGVCYRAIEQAFDNVDSAFHNFFRQRKRGVRAGFPREKIQGRSNRSFTLRGIKPEHIENKRIKLTKIGWVRLKERGYLPNKKVKINAVVISARASRWFISVQVEESRKIMIAKGPPIGIDVGIQHLATCSDGTTFENPQALEQSLRKLVRLQRRLSARKKGGANRKKMQHRIARLHYRIANIRRHSTHCLTKSVVADKAARRIVLEDLNVKGMLSNRSLSRAISDSNFREIRRQFEYKSAWYGNELIIADRFFPSSKKCSQCNHVKARLALSSRTYVCEQCGLRMNRDLNAAKNLCEYVPGSPGELTPLERGGS